MTTIFPSDLRSIARALSGDVAGRQVLAPGPGHSPKDRSLSVTLSPTAPEGFLAFSHAGDDFMACRDYVKAKLGIANDNWRRAEARLVQVAQVEGGRGNESGDLRHIGIAKSIVDGLVGLRGSPGEAYLGNTRRIEVTAIVDVLKRTDSIGWHPAVLFPRRPSPQRQAARLHRRHHEMRHGQAHGGISRTYIHEGQKVAKAKGLGPGVSCGFPLMRTCSAVCTSRRGSKPELPQCRSACDLPGRPDQQQSWQSSLLWPGSRPSASSRMMT